jgi:hypothetical protein
MAGDLERYGGTGRPARFSKATLGVGIAIGLVAALAVNFLVALITGLIRFAVVGTIVIVIGYLVIVGPPSRKRR